MERGPARVPRHSSAATRVNPTCGVKLGNDDRMRVGIGR
jgi:hypothetical protein